MATIRIGNAHKGGIIPPVLKLGWGNKQRGAVVAFLLVAVLGALLGVGVVSETAVLIKEDHQRRDAVSSQAVRTAADLLVTQSLIRAEVPFDINQNIRPRILMLPCPDNIGDGRLDGSQDPTCGSAPPSGINQVSDILNSGSRFGRLPWRSRLTLALQNPQLHDGVDKDLRDGWGNRLWYAVAKNVAPTHKDKNYPLNFHRLATLEEGWLTVYNGEGQVITDKAVAVVLAPHKINVPHLPERALLSRDFAYPDDVLPAGAMLAADRYFEGVTLRVDNGNTITIANNNRDGRFLKMQPTAGFNDRIHYIELNSLSREESAFWHGYKKQLGIGAVHNAVPEGSYLFRQKRALLSYYNFFKFFPAPASGQPDHFSTRHRQCGEFSSGTVAVTVALPNGTVVQSATQMTFTLAVLPTGDEVAVSLSDQPFLLAEEFVFSTVQAVVYNDQAQNVSDVTVATWARVIGSSDNFVIPVTSGDIDLTTKVMTVPAATTLSVQGLMTVAIAPSTALSPSADLVGWLGIKSPSVVLTAGRDGEVFTLYADTAALFLSEVVLTTNVTTITLDGFSPIKFLAGGTLALEEDYGQLNALPPFVYHKNGAAVTVSAAKPLRRDYQKRQLMLWVKSDMVSDRGTVIAPALLFPWREKTSTQAVSRDNLEQYPPCFNPRYYYDAKFRSLVEDQMIIYAVSRFCHFSGDANACGQAGSGGLTVSLAAGARALVPAAVVLTQTYTTTLNRQTVQIIGGALAGTANLTLTTESILPVVQMSQTLVSFRLSAGTVMSLSTTIVIGQATEAIGGDKAVFVDIPALFIYSPAPLPRVPCLRGMATDDYLTVTLSNQATTADDISPFCFWVENEENADADNFFVIDAPNPFSSFISPSNDYFVLLGGRLSW